jgi:hypothetical protein
LYLAPIALELDAQLAELGALSDEDLALQVAIASDKPDWSTDMRQEGLLRTVSHLIDLHGWVLTWDERGIRVSRRGHALVLGVPANFQRYLEDGAGATRVPGSIAARLSLSRDS